MPHRGGFTAQQTVTTLPQVACPENLMVSAATPMENPTGLLNDIENIPFQLMFNVRSSILFIT